MRWRLFFVLWIAAVVGLLLVLPYALDMIPAEVSEVAAGAELLCLPLLGREGQ